MDSLGLGLQLLRSTRDGTTTQAVGGRASQRVANIVGIAAGQNHTVAVKNDATVMAWGYNGYGQLGDGTTTQRNTAISLSGVTNAGGIAASNHTLILNTDGSIWSTGLNTNGQLGKGTATNTSTPATVVNFTFAGRSQCPPLALKEGLTFKDKA